MCRQDRGELWGVDLCGPLMVVDPQTRRIWTSDPDAAGLLDQAGDGWVGALPGGVAIANTTVEWAGVRWIEVMAPLPSTPQERRVLVAHEAWHRAQDAMGLQAQPSDASHLEKERSRTLLRLELRALSIALRSSGRGRRQAVQEALMLRAARLAENPGAAAQEAALDRNEGLAAYTGVKLGVTDNPNLYVARRLDRYDRQESFVRTYADASGPAYGLLLDDYRPAWRRDLADLAPAELLIRTLQLGSWSPSQLLRASDRYGGATVAAEERARAEAQLARLAALRQRFDRGPRVELPLAASQMEFDPNGITPVEGLGTVYEVLTLRDAWGELRAENGALVSADGRRLLVSGPGPDGASGPGWRLSLAPNYHLVGPDGAGIFRPIEIPADAPTETPLP